MKPPLAGQASWPPRSLPANMMKHTILFVWTMEIQGTCGLVAMTSASHAEGRQFDPGQEYVPIRVFLIAGLPLLRLQISACIPVIHVLAAQRHALKMWPGSSLPCPAKSPGLDALPGIDCLASSPLSIIAFHWHHAMPRHLWSSGYDVSLTR